MNDQKIGDVTIKREQFTRWDDENHPECDNSEYLEYDNRGSLIISYGYKRLVYQGEGRSTYRWLKLSEVPESLRGH